MSNFKIEISGIGGEIVEIEKGDGETVILDINGDTSVESIARRYARTLVNELNRYGVEIESVEIVRDFSAAEVNASVRDNLITGIRTVIFEKISETPVDVVAILSETTPPPTIVLTNETVSPLSTSVVTTGSELLGPMGPDSFGGEGFPSSETK